MPNNKAKAQQQQAQLLARQAGKSLRLGAVHVGANAPPIWAESAMNRYGKKGAVGNMETIQEQVYAYLKRLRHSIPFPANTEEVYFECVPDFVREWTEAGYLKSIASVRDVRIKNMLGLFRARYTMGSAKPVQHQVAITISTGGVELVFWLKLHFEALVNPNTLGHMISALEYPTEGKYKHEIEKWIKNSVKLEEEIDYYYRKVCDLHSAISSANVMREVFPGLLNFVSFPNEHSPSIDPNTLRKSKAVFHEILPLQAQQDKLLLLLAAATLLPEEDKLQAGLGYQP